MTLSDKHRKLIRRSGISDEVAEERGYETIPDKDAAHAYGFLDNQARPGLLVPVTWNKESVLYQLRPDVPREIDGRVVKYETPKGKALRLDCPPRAAAALRDRTVPLWITEGVRKADAAVSVGLTCVALLGVDAWRGTVPDGSKGPLEDWGDIELADREVHIAYDSDVMTKASVRDALNRLTLFLVGRGGRPRWVFLPPGDEDVNGQRRKIGLDDYLSGEHTVEELYALARLPARPAVRVGRSLPDMTGDAISALALANDPPVIFQREGILVEARNTGVVRLDPARLRHRLSRAADWERVIKEGSRPVEPPMGVVGDVAVAIEQWPFPSLDRIVTTPVFAPDGSLRSEPGYHAPSRSLYVPPEGLVVPPVADAPTAQDVEKARGLLDDLFTDFTFVDAADRAHALALLLQPFARELIRGATPMYGVEAPRQGTGKTLLVRTALAPAVGEVPTFAEPHGDEEMEKRLTSAFLAAAPTMVLDNVTRAINWPSLASALTTATWQGRELGQSRVVESRVFITWALTGNNPRYSDDMARRVARIRLDAKVTDPHRRTGFTHSLPAYALQRRGELIWAACTLIRAWIVADRPAPPETVPQLASYGPWRRVLAGVLEMHGVAGFLGNYAADAVEEEREEQELLAWLARIAVNEFRGDRFMSSDLLPWLGDEADMLALLPAGRESVSGRLGKFLRDHKGQIISGEKAAWRLEKAPGRSRAGMRWTFTKIDSPEE